MCSDKKVTRRGTCPDDIRWFSESELKKLKLAQEEIKWLFDRGYSTSPVIEFVGNHYQLSARQRLALQRSSSSSLQCSGRAAKLLLPPAAEGKTLHIDGFNLIITLEVAFSNGTLLKGDDGCIRDLAGLRGTYKLIDKTDLAISVLIKALSNLKVSNTIIYLDAPVSNSGRLKSKILEYCNELNFNIDVTIVQNPDVILQNMADIVTSDSVILDNCKSWFNLAKIILDNYIKDAKVICI